MSCTHIFVNPPHFRISLESHWNLLCLVFQLNKIRGMENYKKCTHFKLKKKGIRNQLWKGRSWQPVTFLFDLYIHYNVFIPKMQVSIQVQNISYFCFSLCCLYHFCSALYYITCFISRPTPLGSNNPKYLLRLFLRCQLSLPLFPFLDSFIALKVLHFKVQASSMPEADLRRIPLLEKKTLISLSCIYCCWLYFLALPSSVNLRALKS